MTQKSSKQSFFLVLSLLTQSQKKFILQLLHELLSLFIRTNKGSLWSMIQGHSPSWRGRGGCASMRGLILRAAGRTWITGPQPPFPQSYSGHGPSPQHPVAHSQGHPLQINLFGSILIDTHQVCFHGDSKSHQTGDGTTAHHNSPASCEPHKTNSDWSSKSV